MCFPKSGRRPVRPGREITRGTWTETADKVTVTGTGRTGGGVILTAKVTGADLGSKAHPGEITLNGKHFAVVRRPQVATEARA